MGGWKLEIGKMAMYMAFPVVLFHIFNQPGYFEEWVTSKKRELYPPDNLGHRAELQQAIKDLREKREVQMLKQLEEYEKSQKQ